MSNAAVQLGATEADEARNRSFGAGVVDDPYPTYHRLLALGAVQPGTILEHFPEMAGVPVPGGAVTAPEFSTYSYEACAEVFRRASEFSSSWFDSTLRAAIGHSVIGMDAPDHRRMRLLLQPAFTPKEITRWREEFIEGIVDEHLDAIVGLGRADLHRDVGAAVPVHTISAALGLPVEDRGRFFDWAIGMTSTAVGPESRQAASQAVASYIAPLVAARRAAPSRDLLSVLVLARIADEDAVDGVDRRPLDDDEIATFVRLLIIAGAGTTYRAYGNLMFFLLTEPGLLDAVRDDRALIEPAIEESLRIEQPVAHFGRIARTDTSVGGVAIPAGATVHVNLGAANHDPAMWSEPERFDVHRDRVDRHLTFGFGIHRCLGIHLARAELALLLERTLDRLPNLRLDPEAPGPHVTGLGFRMVTSLSVLFDPQSDPQERP